MACTEKRSKMSKKNSIDVLPSDALDLAGAEIQNEDKDISKSADKLAGVKTTQSTTKEVTKELGGPKGPEPTRYGDWESKGRCYDF